MGAWGIQPFENDDAHNWLPDLESDGFDAIQAAFEETEDQDYLEAPEASAAIAAAAVLASILDGRLDMLHEDAWASVERLKADRSAAEKLRKQALKALKRALGKDSELKELWDEEDELSDWTKTLHDIRDRIDKK
jgi:hypothetical protein